MADAVWDPPETAVSSGFYEHLFNERSSLPDFRRLAIAHHVVVHLLGFAITWAFVVLPKESLHGLTNRREPDENDNDYVVVFTVISATVLMLKATFEALVRWGRVSCSIGSFMIGSCLLAGGVAFAVIDYAYECPGRTMLPISAFTLILIFDVSLEWVCISIIWFIMFFFYASMLLVSYAEDRAISECSDGDHFAGYWQAGIFPLITFVIFGIMGFRELTLAKDIFRRSVKVISLRERLLAVAEKHVLLTAALSHIPAQENQLAAPSEFIVPSVRVANAMRSRSFVRERCPCAVVSIVLMDKSEFKEFAVGPSPMTSDPSVNGSRGSVEVHESIHQPSKLLKIARRLSWDARKSPSESRRNSYASPSQSCACVSGRVAVRGRALACIGELAKRKGFSVLLQDGGCIQLVRTNRSESKVDPGRVISDACELACNIIRMVRSGNLVVNSWAAAGAVSSYRCDYEDSIACSFPGLTAQACVHSGVVDAYFEPRPYGGGLVDVVGPCLLEAAALALLIAKPFSVHFPQVVLDEIISAVVPQSIAHNFPVHTDFTEFCKMVVTEHSLVRQPTILKSVYCDSTVWEARMYGMTVNDGMVDYSGSSAQNRTRRQTVGSMINIELQKSQFHGLTTAVAALVASKGGVHAMVCELLGAQSHPHSCLFATRKPSLRFRDLSIEKQYAMSLQNKSYRSLFVASPLWLWGILSLVAAAAFFTQASTQHALCDETSGTISSVFTVLVYVASGFGTLFGCVMLWMWWKRLGRQDDCVTAMTATPLSPPPTHEIKEMKSPMHGIVPQSPTLRPAGGRVTFLQLDSPPSIPESPSTAPRSRASSTSSMRPMNIPVSNPAPLLGTSPTLGHRSPPMLDSPRDESLALPSPLKSSTTRSPKNLDQYYSAQGKYLSKGGGKSPGMRTAQIPLSQSLPAISLVSGHHGIADTVQRSRAHHSDAESPHARAQTANNGSVDSSETDSCHDEGDAGDFEPHVPFWRKFDDHDNKLELSCGDESRLQLSVLTVHAFFGVAIALTGGLVFSLEADVEDDDDGEDREVVNYYHTFLVGVALACISGLPRGRRVIFVLVAMTLALSVAAYSSCAENGEWYECLGSAMWLGAAAFLIMYLGYRLEKQTRLSWFPLGEAESDQLDQLKQSRFVVDALLDRHLPNWVSVGLLTWACDHGTVQKCSAERCLASGPAGDRSLSVDSVTPAVVPTVALPPGAAAVAREEAVSLTVNICCEADVSVVASPAMPTVDIPASNQSTAQLPATDTVETKATDGAPERQPSLTAIASPLVRNRAYSGGVEGENPDERRRRLTIRMYSVIQAVLREGSDAISTDPLLDRARAELPRLDLREAGCVVGPTMSSSGLTIVVSSRHSGERRLKENARLVLALLNTIRTIVVQYGRRKGVHMVMSVGIARGPLLLGVAGSRSLRICPPHTVVPTARQIGAPGSPSGSPGSGSKRQPSSKGVGRNQGVLRGGSRSTDSPHPHPAGGNRPRSMTASRASASNPYTDGTTTGDQDYLESALLLDAWGLCRLQAQYLVHSGDKGSISVCPRTKELLEEHAPHSDLMKYRFQPSIQFPSHLRGDLPEAATAYSLVRSMDKWGLDEWDFSKQTLSVNEFVFVRKLGKGGFGNVYLANIAHAKEAKKFAIKAMNSIQGESIMTELQVLFSIQHPNIVKLFYCLRDVDNWYLVMEYIEGGTLDRVISNFDLDSHYSRFYSAEITLALSYLHSQGIVHKDLKPENCMVRKNGHLCLVDFGLSRRLPKNQPQFIRTNTVAAISRFADAADSMDSGGNKGGARRGSMLRGFRPSRGGSSAFNSKDRSDDASDSSSKDNRNRSKRRTLNRLVATDILPTAIVQPHSPHLSGRKVSRTSSALPGLRSLQQDEELPMSPKTPKFSMHSHASMSSVDAWFQDTYGDGKKAGSRRRSQSDARLDLSPLMNHGSLGTPRSEPRGSPMATAPMPAPTGGRPRSHTEGGMIPLMHPSVRAVRQDDPLSTQSPASGKSTSGVSSQYAGSPASGYYMSPSGCSVQSANSPLGSEMTIDEALPEEAPTLALTSAKALMNPDKRLSDLEAARQGATSPVITLAAAQGVMKPVGTPTSNRATFPLLGEFPAEASEASSEASRPIGGGDATHDDASEASFRDRSGSEHQLVSPSTLAPRIQATEAVVGALPVSRRASISNIDEVSPETALSEPVVRPSGDSFVFGPHAVGTDSKDQDSKDRVLVSLESQQTLSGPSCLESNPESCPSTPLQPTAPTTPALALSTQQSEAGSELTTPVFMHRSTIPESMNTKWGDEGFGGRRGTYRNLSDVIQQDLDVSSPKSEPAYVLYDDDEGGPTRGNVLRPNPLSSSSASSSSRGVEDVGYLTDRSTGGSIPTYFAPPTRTQSAPVIPVVQISTPDGDSMNCADMMASFGCNSRSTQRARKVGLTVEVGEPIDEPVGVSDQEVTPKGSSVIKRITQSLFSPAMGSPTSNTSPSTTIPVSPNHTPMSSSAAARDEKPYRKFGLLNTGFRGGTPYYMAPELIKKESYGTPIDWWALGCVLFECVMGDPPFMGRNEQEIFEKALLGSAAIDWDEYPKIPSACRKFITELLNPDPNLRLGAGGALDVMNHRFFKKIDWASVNKDEAPFIPDFDDPADPDDPPDPDPDPEAGISAAVVEASGVGVPANPVEVEAVPSVNVAPNTGTASKTDPAEVLIKLSATETAAGAPPVLPVDVDVAMEPSLGGVSVRGNLSDGSTMDTTTIDTHAALNKNREGSSERSDGVAALAATALIPDAAVNSINTTHGSNLTVSVNDSQPAPKELRSQTDKADVSNPSDPCSTPVLAVVDAGQSSQKTTIPAENVSPTQVELVSLPAEMSNKPSPLAKTLS